MSRSYNVLKKVTTKLENEILLINLSTSQPLNIPTALIIGVFHGDEPQGKFLIEEYLKKYPLSPTLPLEGGGSKTPQQYSKFALLKAKDLRKNQTDAEQKLWQYLRADRFYGLKFKRQQPIGRYIADFICFEHKIIIELDGGQHFDNADYDNNRTRFLNDAGYDVIRIWNNDIFENIEGVLEHIKNSLPPRGGGLGRGGNLLFIPCLNPDGMQLGTRTNANGVDLNRNFPTKNWGEDSSLAGDNPSDYYGGNSAGSEIETQFVIDVIEKYKPELIITLHAPYKVVNYDGPAREIAEKISEIIKYPVEASIGYPTPGSFGTYAGVERQIPTITLELDETCSVEDLIEPIFEIFDEVL